MSMEVSASTRQFRETAIAAPASIRRTNTIRLMLGVRILARGRGWRVFTAARPEAIEKAQQFA
eukprot:877857-Ditylum_brightwellii.AAC.1